VGYIFLEKGTEEFLAVRQASGNESDFGSAQSKGPLLYQRANQGEGSESY
jgi:hypothetical protein